MQRNLFSQNYDVIIVGTGAAGLFAALNFEEKYNILMITKSKLENSDSYLAQGGISVLKDEMDYQLYFEDTLKAGHYKNKLWSVKIMIDSSRKTIEELIHLGVEFDRNDKGGFSYTKEGAHSAFRILHHKDATGREITSKLWNQVQERPNITLLEYTEMIDLIVKNNLCSGIVAKCSDGTYNAIRCKTVLLATGGLGGLFENTTNFSHITGDSFAIALSHGIELENINYIQMHPTALYSEKKGRKFLISESVRGEGGILTNHKGKRFVNELLPRDTVAEAISREMKNSGNPYVYLSVQHMNREKIMKRFPNIYSYCLEQGIDITRDRIPVTPAQHYLMGGIQIDSYGVTSCKNLYAVGETACNGVHGANRLASNSLLESLVFSKRAAAHIQRRLGHIEFADTAIDLEPYKNETGRSERFFNLVMNEIKRKDEEFYAKWCNHAG